ncbi:MAG TPA: peptidylprolyl isomerase [Vicinamibacterales bacterium]|nr:peptidylprolyl isomerase [Vicinamibacterales bacterium]
MLLCVFVCAAGAQTPVGTVAVLVVDENQRVLGDATVTLISSTSRAARQSASGADGVATFTGVAVGIYEVTASRPGVSVTARDVVVKSAEVTQLAILLLPPPREGPGPKAVVEVVVKLETALGPIRIAVNTTHAPATAANFLRYVDGGFYDGGRFHRASTAPLQLVQGGVNPDRDGERFDPIPLERTSVTGLRHVSGAVSMARLPAADSARAEFFIVLDYAPSLDFGGQTFDDGQGAAVFGRVLEGLDVLRRIQQLPTRQQALTRPVTILRAYRER